MNQSVYSGDLESLLLEIGWVKLVDNVYIAEDGMAIDLSGKMIEFIDLIYSKGWTGGLHRGLYETETMEDVEKGDMVRTAESAKIHVSYYPIKGLKDCA